MEEEREVLLTFPVKNTHQSYKRDGLLKQTVSFPFHRYISKIQLLRLIPTDAIDGVVVIYPILNIDGGKFISGVADDHPFDPGVDDEALAHGARVRPSHKFTGFHILTCQI